MLVCFRYQEPKFLEKKVRERISNLIFANWNMSSSHNELLLAATQTRRLSKGIIGSASFINAINGGFVVAMNENARGGPFIYP